MQDGSSGRANRERLLGGRGRESGEQNYVRFEAEGTAQTALVAGPTGVNLLGGNTILPQ